MSKLENSLYTNSALQIQFYTIPVACKYLQLDSSFFFSYLLHEFCMMLAFGDAKFKRKNESRDMPRTCLHALASLILKKSLQNNHHALLSPLADRVTASKATPQPVAPPPTQETNTHTSKRVSPR